jgi:hypothetical protein
MKEKLLLNNHQMQVIKEANMLTFNVLYNA